MPTDMVRPPAPRQITGLVFDLQRMCVHDGPGIRTTVFLKGCPLACWWCHNPEGRSSRPELSFSPQLCIDCHACFDVCPNRAHRVTDAGHTIDRGRCTRCMRCVEACCSEALECVGREYTVDEVLSEVERDRPFYEESGGGLTIGGGEPLAQFDFTRALLEEAQRRGLHTCLETSAARHGDQLPDLAASCDLFLVDYKESDPERHRLYTGVERDRVVRTIRALDRAGARIVLRCPIIPGVNLREDHLRGIVEMATALKHCEQIEILGYHLLGNSKRACLGCESEPGHALPTENMPPDAVQSVVNRLQEMTPVKVTAT